MIISQEELKELFCKTVKIKKKQVEECTYPAGKEFDDMLYSGMLGLVISAIALVLHVLFYVLNSTIKRDFAKCFVTSTFHALDVSTLFMIIGVVQGIMYEDRNGLGQAIVEHAFTVSMTAAFVTAVLGMVCFIFMSAITVCRRSVPSMEDSWTVFLSTELLGWLASCSYHLTAIEFRTLPNIVIVVLMCLALFIVIIAIITGLITFALCGKKKMAEECEDPVVYNARPRLIWAIASVVMIIPAVIGLFLYCCELMNKTPDSVDFNIDLAVSDYYTNRILQFFAGPVMVLTIFMLPTYRNALLQLPCKLKSKLKRPKKEKKDQKAPLLSNAQVHPAPPMPAPEMEKKEQPKDHPEPPPPPSAQPPAAAPEPGLQVPQAHMMPAAPVAYDEIIDIRPPMIQYPQGMGQYPQGPGPQYPQGPGHQVGFGNGFVQIPPNYHATVVHTAPR